MIAASSGYWKLALKKGFSDPEVNAAADRFQQASDVIVPSLRALASAETPADVVGAIRGFADASAAAFADKEVARSNAVVSAFAKSAEEVGHSADHYESTDGGSAAGLA